MFNNWGRDKYWNVTQSTTMYFKIMCLKERENALYMTFSKKNKTKHTGYQIINAVQLQLGF